MRAFLRANRGHIVLLQCYGFAVRGRLDKVRRDGVTMSEVQMLDETARTPEWKQGDGTMSIAANVIRFVQVA